MQFRVLFCAKTYIIHKQGNNTGEGITVHCVALPYTARPPSQESSHGQDSCKQGGFDLAPLDLRYLHPTRLKGRVSSEWERHGVTRVGTPGWLIEAQPVVHIPSSGHGRTKPICKDSIENWAKPVNKINM